MLTSIRKILLMIILRLNISYFGSLLAHNPAQQIPDLWLLPLSTTTTQQWILIMLFILQLKLPGRSEILQVKYQESFPLTPAPPLCPPGQFLHGSLMDFNYTAVLEGRKVLTGKDDGGVRQNKWLIQGHAGNLMLCQEQSVSSLSSS